MKNLQITYSQNINIKFNKKNPKWIKTTSGQTTGIAKTKTTTKQQQNKLPLRNFYQASAPLIEESNIVESPVVLGNTS